LAANFAPVWDVAQLELASNEAEVVFPPPGYSFEFFFAPNQTGSPQAGKAELASDRLNVLFKDASEEVFQKLIGTALRLFEEIKTGSEVQLRQPDGSVRQITISVPDDLKRRRFRRGKSAEPEAE
jgi:hypothetical protein